MLCNCVCAIILWHPVGCKKRAGEARVKTASGMTWLKKRGCPFKTASGLELCVFFIVQKMHVAHWPQRR